MAAFRADPKRPRFFFGEKATIVGSKSIVIKDVLNYYERVG
jgi:hypothetical protein